ncbi:hypothetical protein B0O99DRAFT_738554 [Bisporella sp. PMI_857]|nr:hypothetical protein B0O99DRAFT_738554 [Bisporella sp. PMI_857]
MLLFSRNSTCGGISAPPQLPVKFNDNKLMRTSTFILIKYCLHKDKITVVRMPYSECLKYFAHDESGQYARREEEMEWTEQDLDEEFGKNAVYAAPKWVVRGE